ncbi:MAG: hypothetical protein H0T79_03670, partial [Deltaproteobacteria bacterium]|nr:hypothetical protein [Deltaproteobacteria bacterium]
MKKVDDSAVVSHAHHPARDRVDDLLDGGWSGEPHHVELDAPGYEGGTGLIVSINSLVVDIRYVWIIAT